MPAGRRLVTAAAAAAVPAGLAALAWARRRFLLVTVKGNSMAPTYRDGQRLIVRRGRYAAGDVVMFRAPGHLPARVDWLVKRAVAVPGDPVPADMADRAHAAVVPPGRLLVRSDAPDGLDSRQLGLIDDRDVLGVVCWLGSSRVAGLPRYDG
jgi:signal peptidase I